MDMGKIMIGIALVMLSVGLLISPSGATGCDHSCTVGCGSAVFPADAPVTPYSPQERESPAGYLVQACGNASYGSALVTPPVPASGASLGKSHATV